MYIISKQPFDWKLFADVDNEGYHIKEGHPGFNRLFGNSYYDEVVENGISRAFCVLEDKISPVWSEGLYQKLLPEATHLP